jgi:23S rRNA pseudouridine1911/1915/1917 synthase
MKLIDFVAKRAGSRKRAKRAIDEGLVSVNFKKELHYRRPISNKDVVIVAPLTYLFEKKEPFLIKDASPFFLISKPPFLEHYEFEELVRKKFGSDLKLAHRLDKQTSGVILAVKGREAFEKIKELFKRRKVFKEYLALLKGRVKGRLKINKKLDGREALTLIEPLEWYGKATLCRVIIETGRKHQIRRHAASVGHPIVGEFTYYRGAWPKELLLAPRIMLHSRALEIKELGLKGEAEPPDDFKEFLNSLLLKKD